jgi:capsid portal protein
MRSTPEGIYAVKGAQFQAVELPDIKEVRGKEYMYYGNLNLFPQSLIELYDTSAMHHTCIDAITAGIVGDGIEIIGDEYVNQKGETVNEIFEKVSLDYTLYNGYAINVVWNKERTKIAEMYHLPFANVRSGKPNEEDVVEEYMYSADWANLRKYPYQTYKAFDTTDNKGDNASQVFYFYGYTPGNQVYPLPGYVAAMNDISLDAQVSRFHANNIANGLAPSMFVQFRNGVPSPEERRDVYKEIEKTFTGTENAGRFFLAFSEPGKEMQVTPIDSANDDYYLLLEQRISSRILTAHRITSPLLLGIKDGAGFSSNAEEIKVAYAHFEGTVVEPKRKKIVSGFGYMLRLAGYNVGIKIRPNKLVNEEEVTDVQPQTNIESL